MINRTLYLSSMDSIAFKPIRKCTYIKEVTFDSGKECVLAELDPPVAGEQFGINKEIKHIIITCRHQGDSLFAPDFPCFVFIAYLLKDETTLRKTIKKEELQVLAWGELYDTYEQAVAIEDNSNI